MADLSRSAHIPTLFEFALQTYTKKTSVTLVQHPFAVKLQSCNSVEDTTTFLQDQIWAFDDVQARHRIVGSVKTTISVLTHLSAPASFADAVGLTSLPPAKAIQVALAILLDEAKGAICSPDALIDLLESIEQYVNRLDIYARIPLTPSMVEICVKIMIEILSILASVTNDLKQRRSIKLVKKLLGEKDVEGVLQRLDRLTQHEVRTTAAQTLEVVHSLFQTMRVVMDDGKASLDCVREVLETVHRMTIDMNKLKRNQLLRDIRTWLSPPDSSKNYNIARESRHGETGAWFLNSDTLSEWKASGRSSLLWIHGKTGTGKTVLCSTIVEGIHTLRKSGLASLAIFYFDFREDQKKDRRGLLSSVLYQLCGQSDSYYDILSNFYSEYSDGTQSPSDNELVQCLKELLRLPGQAPVYLIIDALDECPDTSTLSSSRAEVLTLLADLVDSQLPNLRICVTSRPEPDIKLVLQPLTFRSISLHDESGQREDIENYIKAIVKENKNMQRWTPEDKQRVIDALIERADGMFRWTYCQLDYLGKCLPACLQDALDELPDTLDGTYERTLREINNRNWEFARRLLHCVAVVYRPLRVEELAEFLAFDFKAGPIPIFHEDWRLGDPVEAVLSTCSTFLSLVTADDSQVIQFSHLSVKDFLMSSRFTEKHDLISNRFQISMAPAHTLVAQACLGILLHLDKDITRDRLKNFALVEYAAEYWFVHVRFEGVSQNVVEGMKQLFDGSKRHLSIWLWINDPTMTSKERNKSIESPLTPSGTPLHYAAFCGLQDIVEVLATEDSQDVNSRSFKGNLNPTPLHLASRGGHVDVARILVEHGADVSAKNTRGWTPLHQASFEGHLELARFIIERGASVAAEDKDRWTSLHRASYGGHTELAQLLIKHGANVVARDKNGRTPLHRASERGHVGLSRVLVRHGASAAIQDKRCLTPLHLVSFGAHMELTQLLLQHGGSVTAQDKEGWTPLHGASNWGRVRLARLLIEHCADVKAQDKRGWTPLHRASERGHVDLAWLLIQHGADAAAQDKRRRTPLHWASQRGHVELAQLLIQHGADPAVQDEDEWTPLRRAEEEGHVELARLLVERGANIVAAKDEGGRTPLHGRWKGATSSSNKSSITVPMR